MYFEYDYGTMYYEQYGTGKKAIVLLPGWGETRITFRGMIQFLAEYFTVYIVDYPGLGNSSIPTKDFTIFDYSNLIYDWIKTLDLEDPILIGHSFGGRIIITLCGYYHFPFSKVILMNSAGIRPKKTLRTHLRSFFYKTAQKATQLLPKKWKRKCKQWLFERFSSDDYKALPEAMRPTFHNVISEDLSPYLKEIKSDVLLLWGRLDTATPLRDGMKMKEEIPDADLIVIERTGHFSYLENPPLVHSILYEDLKEDILSIDK